MDFKGRLKILEISRLGRGAPIGRYLVRVPPSNTFAKLRCNLTKVLIVGILTIALKFLQCRAWPEPPR